jgi:hypothetical protein
MFPKTKVFCFDGCVRNVVAVLTKKPLDDVDIVFTERDMIYLGHFLRSEPIVWNNKKTIYDGVAVFERGAIMFPDYRHVKIYKGAKIQ